jgi:hypothetical protein
MKNSELNQILKSAPVPDRPDAFWDEFPRRVMAKAHWRQTQSPAKVNRPWTGPFGSRFRLQLATFGLGLAVIGLLLGYAFGFRQGRRLSITESQLAAARQYFQEIDTLFPNQVRAIVFDSQGPHLVLAEHPNVTTTSPLYLRIRGPKGFQDFVTFSGQQIRFNGEVCEVLLDHQGNVMLVGQQWVWSAAQTAAENARYQIAARPLERTL